MDCKPGLIPWRWRLPSFAPTNGEPAASRSAWVSPAVGKARSLAILLRAICDQKNQCRQSACHYLAKVIMEVKFNKAIEVIESTQAAVYFNACTCLLRITRAAIFIL